MSAQFEIEEEINSNFVEETNAIPAFNAKMTVTSLLVSQLENAALNLSRRCVIELARKYGFSADEALAFLNLGALSLEKKSMAKKSKDPNAPKTASKTKKLSIPMPFCGEVNETICFGLKYNYGLFTQCSTAKMENGQFCASCQKEADESTNKKPINGTIQERAACADFMAFKDPKGRKTIQYCRILEKKGFSMEQAIEEATKLNINLPEVHLLVLPPLEKKAEAGRPKTEGTAIEAENTSDLFGNLVNNSENASATSSQKRVRLSKEEREIRDKNLAAEKEQKKINDALKKQQEVTAKALASIGKTLADLMEAGVPVDIADAAIGKHKEALKKKEEAAAKRKEEAALKKAQKSKPATNSSISTPTPTPIPTPVKEEEPKKVAVKRVTINGIEYLKTPANILYIASTKEEAGTWDEINQIIIPLADDEELEEEEM